MIQPWKKLSEEPVNVGWRKMLRRQFTMPDGSEKEYVVKNEGHGVNTLAFTEDNKIILAKQFRPGPEKILYAIPGGYADPNEELIDAARRELLEETGFDGDIEYVNNSWQCGYSNFVRHNFIAKNCKKVQEQQLDEDEYIDLYFAELEELKEMLRKGEVFSDAEPVYVGLDYLGLL